MSHNASTLYIPVITPPTPAPSPGPSIQPPSSSTLISTSVHEFSLLPSLHRRQFLSAILSDCTPDELLFVSTTVAPLLQRDFLRDLPPEIATYILSFVDAPRSLLSAGRVSRYWNGLVSEEWLWKRMCAIHEFDAEDDWDFEDVHDEAASLPSPISPAMHGQFAQSAEPPQRRFSYRQHFKLSYMIRE